MGTVIRFPVERLSRDRPAERRKEPATVVILPIVRTERWAERTQPTPVQAAAKSRRLPRVQAPD